MSMYWSHRNLSRRISMRREAFLLLFPLKIKNRERAKRQRGLLKIPVAVRGLLDISVVTTISLKGSMWTTQNLTSADSCSSISTFWKSSKTWLNQWGQGSKIRRSLFLWHHKTMILKKLFWSAILPSNQKFIRSVLNRSQIIYNNFYN